MWVKPSTGATISGTCVNIPVYSGSMQTNACPANYVMVSITHFNSFGDDAMAGGEKLTCCKLN